MLCEICHKNEATVDLTRIVDGEIKKMTLCAGCAAQKKPDIQSPITLTDILFGLGTSAAGETSPPDESCPQCHMRLSDFRKTSQLGCAACYETFARELAPMFKSIHRGIQHVGKIPRREKMRVEIRVMEQQLRGAVAEQKFEEAARLRDHIRAMRDRDTKQNLRKEMPRES